MASEKSNVPRFFVASKIKNMVKGIPSAVNIKAKNGPASPTAAKDRDNDTIHSFHIQESQQKPFMDCDTLFADCEEFLKLTYRAIEINNNKGKSGLSKLVHAVPISDKISKWQSKKKESELHETYETIQSRAEQMHTVLDEIGNVAAVSTSALITQSVHLNVRLTSCVDYNRGEVDKNKPVVTEGRIFLNKLKSNEKALLAMIDFLEEVTELKRIEPKPYIPWGMRQQVEDELEAERQAALKRNDIVELKRSSIEKRIKRIRKIIVPVERLYKVTEESQHVRLNNLSHCLRSQLALLNFLHRCQSNVGTASSAQALVQKSAGGALPLPPSSSPGAATKKGGITIANPIKNHKSVSAPSSMKGTSPMGSYKPTLAELASGVIPGGGAGASTSSIKSNSASERGSESSNEGSRSSFQAASKPRTSQGPDLASFDNDSEEDEEDKNDDEEADDPSNPDNSIEKAVRHMRVALTGLQRNSGLVLEKVAPYDHNNCSDCGVVYDMANDCCMHIAAANFRSKQCAERLLRLNGYLEKMRENVDLLEVQETGHTQSVDR